MGIWICFLCAALSEGVTFVLCLEIARRLDREENLRLRTGQTVFWALLCVVNALLVALLGRSQEEIGKRGAILLGAAAGSLLFACLTDRRCCKVYDYVWWLVMVAGGLLLWFQPGWWSGVWGQLICFLLLQRFLFDQFYGRADVYAFCACGLIESSFGMGFLEYILHMAGAFLLLAVIQAVKHNIGPDGNLKRPVPFLPYITVAFWITLLWENYCNNPIPPI